MYNYDQQNFRNVQLLGYFDKLYISNFCSFITNEDCVNEKCTYYTVYDIVWQPVKILNPR